MRVLVAYATRHGATGGIAERVAAVLRRRGLDVTLTRAREARDPATFDAFVIGGAAYMFHWLDEVRDFARRNRTLLADRPTWIFSSGPLGTDLVDAEGKDVRIGAEPKEFPELREDLRPRDARVFFGAYDPDAKPIGLGERLMGLMPAARNALPAGDFRDWPEIEAWAEGIANELLAVPA